MAGKGLEARVSSIEQRNRRVESDKAWEISKTRRAIIVVFTYLAIGAYLLVIGVPNALLNAVVPTVAFTLSTLTLPFFKKLWIESVYTR